MSAKKKTASKREQRRIRTQQIIFGIIAVVIIISWIIAMVAN
ncbi:MAG TPA: hypothetical protein VJL34_12950 [Anaerolineales bacterium]|nr:hypothetical protein [Anaerolineales bacterium]